MNQSNSKAKKHFLWVVFFIVVASMSFMLVSCTDTGADTGESQSITEEKTTLNETESKALENTETEAEENSESASQTETVSETETEKAEETESITETDTEPYKDDSCIVLYDFSDIPESLDWEKTPFGIVNPVLMLDNDDEHVDSGYGLQVTLPNEAAWCQSLTMNISGWESRQYIRLWVDNTTNGNLSVGLTIYSENKNSAACLKADNALIYTANGKSVICAANDCSGMGAGVNTSIELPSGFRGWVAFPLDTLVNRREEALLNGTPAVINIDLRPTSFVQGDSYMLDELVLSDIPYGCPRGGDISVLPPKGIAEKLEQIENVLNQCQKDKVEYTEYPEYNPDGIYEGIKAIAYEGVDRNSNKTKVFAYVGYPKGADNTTPAIVLIHGGGGHSFLQWMKLWMDKGYTVIAPDVTGYFPNAKNAGADESQNGWVYGLHGAFMQEGYSSLPNNDGMTYSASALENQWMYHALAATAKAFSLLEQSGKCDPGKIGVTGISWGGVITSLYIGYDSRPAFAIPIYGTAYLDEALSWIKDNFAGKDTRALWSAKDRLDKVDYPVLWLVWNDDNCFSLNSASKSYLDTMNIEGTRLSAVNGMLHGHSVAWARTESYIFANSIVKGGEELPTFVTLPDQNSVSCKVENGKRAKLYYLTEEMTYSTHTKYGYESTFMDQTWKTQSLTLNADGTVSGQIPSDAKVYYIEITAAHNNYVTSPLVYIK